MMISCHVFIDFTERCEQEQLSAEVSFPVVPQIGWHLNYILRNKDFCFWEFKVCKVELSPTITGNHAPVVYALLDEKESIGPGNMAILDRIAPADLLVRVIHFVNEATKEGWKA